MKQRRFILAHYSAARTAAEAIAEQPLDGSVEVVIRNTTVLKTLQQLGGLFGSWEKHLAEEVHYCGLGEVHDMLKAKFLARIYMRDYGSEKGSPNEMQDWWCGMCILLQERQDRGELLDSCKLEVHAKKISLAWSTKEQMREFMDAIESEYQSLGSPLPVLDPLWREREDYWREW